MGQTFSSSEYFNCRDLDHASMSMQYFIYVKVNFEKKNPVLHIENFPFLVLPRNTMIQHLIISAHAQKIGSGSELTKRSAASVDENGSGINKNKNHANAVSHRYKPLTLRLRNIDFSRFVVRRNLCGGHRLQRLSNSNWTEWSTIQGVIA